MLSCRQVSEQASYFIEGEISFMERLNLRLHLIICVHCRRFLRQFRMASAVSRRLSNEQPVDDQMAATQAAILKSKLESRD